ncbi:HigA family addiction module antidote protein [Salmonella enterica]|uniref:Addiction module antidote protein, HigA family n=3 Tax=Salmonella enterica I TaxID=59201 RepID=A0A5U8JEC7_SALET|nr:HigA family addiction module antitoxin [Salmonella enterica]EAW1162079.1 addiction module antidote protein, HigA family [Salmonella enterica subsp. enterica]EAW1318456.1 addiction module antidote protein, HigA family [Salmonella enterica subsp. diarizonae]EBR7996906.1 addiction module antidote protein, HigA family [Salmonella enterica subsp. enterica serovar Panama]EBS4088751.1 addiction module antidote protein, HigA family [Salmonella enterica subsp. enterica serovar Newport]EBW8394025.1 a
MKMANPAYPGQIIAETLEDLNVSVRQFAKAMEIAPSTASRLLSGQTAVTPEMAIRLSVVIGSTPETWLKIQSNYSLSEAREKVDIHHLHRLSCV